jgi:hypothetical protein
MKPKDNFNPKTPESKQAQVYEINISAGWDTVSMAEIFFEKLKTLPFYRNNLLYSGFNAEGSGASLIKAATRERISCGKEEDMINPPEGANIQNPFEFATSYKNTNPAIAIYDPLKMEAIKDSKQPIEIKYAYRMKHPSALLAVIKLIVPPSKF